MKRIYCFFVLGLCLLYACSGNRQVTEQLDRAEALLEAAHPDSAWALLDSLDTPDRWSDRPFARWCMLYCRTADKLYKDMLYTEQLTRALDWYKRHGSAEETAWMGLYLGRSYVEDKLFLPATNTYAEALALAEKEKLYNVAGYICSYMADLYAYTRQTTEERRKFEEAATYFQKAGNQRSYAFALRDIAKTWTFNDSLSLALNLMQKADSIIMLSNNRSEIGEIANGLGIVYESIGKIEIAKNYFSKSLKYDTANQAPTYLALSSLYYNQSIFDSARLYLEKVTYSTSNPYTAIDRLYLGYLIEKEAGEIEKSLDYLEQYHEKKDSLYDSEKQVDIIDAEKRHNVVLLLEQNKKLTQERIFITIATIITICVLILIYQKKVRKHILEINHKQLLLEKEKYRHDKEEKGMEERISQLTKEIEQKREAYNDTVKNKKTISKLHKDLNTLRYEKFRQSDLYNQIKEQCRTVKPDKEQKLTEKDWFNLIRLVNIVFPNVGAFIGNNTLGLTKADVEMCYLSFFDLSLSEEAILLGISTASVNKRRSRTRQKLSPDKKEIDIKTFILLQGW